eukprot:1153452-Pelagomonas_calceolata.AAC.2
MKRLHDHASLYAGMHKRALSPFLCPRRSALDGSEHLALVVGSISSDRSAAASPQGPVHVCVHHEQHGVDLLTGVTAATSGTLVSESTSSSGNGGAAGGLSSPSCSSSSLDGALCAVASQGGGVVLYMRSRSGDVQDVDGRSSSSRSSILTQCRALHQQQQAGSNGTGPAGNGAAGEGAQDSTFDLKAYGLAAQVRRVCREKTSMLALNFRGVFAGGCTGEFALCKHCSKMSAAREDGRVRDGLSTVQAVWKGVVATLSSAPYQMLLLSLQEKQLTGGKDSLLRCTYACAGLPATKAEARAFRSMHNKS